MNSKTKALDKINIEMGRGKEILYVLGRQKQFAYLDDVKINELGRTPYLKEKVCKRITFGFV
ncbi:hypothetical protein SRABI96_04823 [Peribacillus sp. Bi96]|uniref:hypothetical protein n=1 Tax=unclassified Peribacillus TaxID=2675266 RepID=UPI001D2A5956|nr:hypothetical protein [Peribacillus sp. Bi96]CAH0306997.1 hypothetical protein SRABI96_04823 [Peribacillus sp. Bi96]